MGAIPRMNIHQRLQHGFLLLSVGTALVTGQGIALGLSPAGLGFAAWYRLHLWAGVAAAATVTYHLLYLLVRGYVEGTHWPSFPLAWSRDSWRQLKGDLGFVLGFRPERPEAGLFRASQKALYWGTAFLILGLSFTGVAIGYWEHLGSSGLLQLLDVLAQVHRGLGLVFLAVMLWHLWGVLFWEGRWNPQWTWLTGQISQDLAVRKLPGLYRQHLFEEEHRRRSAEEIEEEEAVLERTQVENELKKGNKLAKEGKYVDAVYCYRKALEHYPGYSQARFNMAVVLQKMGERAMAVETFRQFIEKDPFHPLARKAQESIADLEKELST